MLESLSIRSSAVRKLADLDQATRLRTLRAGRCAQLKTLAWEGPDEGAIPRLEFADFHACAKLPDESLVRILTGDEVNLRLQIIRPAKVDLLNVTINLQVFVTGGRVHQLSLTNGIEGYGAWFGFAPMNIRHKIDENSPLRDDYPGGKQDVYFIRVSLSATDSNGNPVNAFATYYHPDSFFMGMADFRAAWAERGIMPPRILRGVRWKDQMRRIRDGSTGKGTEGAGLPTWLVNVDNTEGFEPIPGDSPV